MPTNLEVSFLPWTEFGERVELDPVVFWSFQSESSERIEDPEIRQHLDRYFKSYVDHRGSPVKTVTVCSIGDADCREFTEEEYRHVRDAVNTLVFIVISQSVVDGVCSGNYSVGPPSADAFELITQRFIPGDDHIAVRAGNLLSGGLRIGKVTFPKPRAMGGSSWGIDSELLEGFRACYSRAVDPQVQERIRLSLDWFRLAHIEGSGVSLLSRVIMMATAFEILLAFPDNDKSGFFAKHVDENIASGEFCRDERYTRRGKKLHFTVVGCWAFDFYQLRSRIVHGQQVASAEMVYHGEITTMMVADIVFWECVKRLLFEHEFIGDAARACSKKLDEMSPESSAGSTLDHIAREMLGFNDVHRALGWVGPADGCS